MHKSEGVLSKNRHTDTRVTCMQRNDESSGAVGGKEFTIVYRTLGDLDNVSKIRNFSYPAGDDYPAKANFNL